MERTKEINSPSSTCVTIGVEERRRAEVFSTDAADAEHSGYAEWFVLQSTIIQQCERHYHTKKSNWKNLAFESIRAQRDADVFSFVNKPINKGSKIERRVIQGKKFR